PTAETFSAPSKPRLYYTRPASGGSSRELPRVRSPLVPILSLSLFGLSAWAAFLLYATNQEKLASSVVRHVLQSVRDCEELKRSAGSGSKVEPEGKWWLGGDAWVWGKINLPAGNVDLSFRLKGPGGSGTLYFTSIRKAKGEAFTPLRFRVIADDGRVVNV
ncbi:cytochrome oxidase complex assembly protein 1-domain-containing protein, partial [Hygrophoropsis aurantiaca]